MQARNLVALGTGRGYALIDLDASAPIDGKSQVASKTTSSGCLPPEQAIVLLHKRQARRPTADAENCLAELRQLRRAAANGEADEVVIELSKKIQALKGAMVRVSDEFRSMSNCGTVAAREALTSELQQLVSASLPAHRAMSKDTPTPPPQPTAPIASKAYDMWCFGVLLYQLCTGQTLFHTDAREDVNEEELALLVEWSDGTKSSKLDQIADPWPRVLLEQLLTKNPAHRLVCEAVLHAL